MPFFIFMLFVKNRSLIMRLVVDRFAEFNCGSESLLSWKPLFNNIDVFVNDKVLLIIIIIIIRTHHMQQNPKMYIFHIECTFPYC